MPRKYFYACLCFIFSFAAIYAKEPDLMQSEIKHVVILMFENRSFDNVMAWLDDKNNAPAHFIPAETDPNFIGLLEENLDQYTNHLKKLQRRDSIFLLSYQRNSLYRFVEIFKFSQI